MTLLIGTDFVGQKLDAEYGIKAQSSRREIEAILPGVIRTEASRVRSTIRLLADDEDQMNGQEKEYIDVLRRAILAERTKRCWGMSLQSVIHDNKNFWKRRFQLIASFLYNGYSSG